MPAMCCPQLAQGSVPARPLAADGQRILLRRRWRPVWHYCDGQADVVLVDPALALPVVSDWLQTSRRFEALDLGLGLGQE